MVVCWSMQCTGWVCGVNAYGGVLVYAVLSVSPNGGTVWCAVHHSNSSCCFQFCSWSMNLHLMYKHRLGVLL